MKDKTKDFNKMSDTSAETRTSEFSGFEHEPFAVEKAPSHRPARFAQSLRQELATMIPGNLKDPRLTGPWLLTITSIEVSQDFRNANVMFSVTASDEKQMRSIEDALNQASGFLRKELTRRLTTKVTPHLRFRLDRGFEHASQISKLLKTI